MVKQTRISLSRSQNLDFARLFLMFIPKKYPTGYAVSKGPPAAAGLAPCSNFTQILTIGLQLRRWNNSRIMTKECISMMFMDGEFSAGSVL